MYTITFVYITISCMATLLWDEFEESIKINGENEWEAATKAAGKTKDR